MNKSGVPFAFAALLIFLVLFPLLTRTAQPAPDAEQVVRPIERPQQVQPIPQSAVPFVRQDRGADAIGQAFAGHLSDVPVTGTGTVYRVLDDDPNPPRHQRFLVRLSNGQSLLIAHNIDVAQRIAGLREGQIVSFSGEYVWNDRGGLVHWTHHDPGGLHAAGWIQYAGQTYQ